MEERWITALDYAELYEVSDLGRIKCLDKNGARECIMKVDHTNSKYNRITLYRNNEAKSFRVDEIVLRSFLKIEEKFIDIHHNSNDLDDALNNLSYSPSCKSIDGEVWAAVPMYPDYEVSTFGRVRNSKHHIMKTNVRPDGYEWTYLASKSNPNNMSIHRLVALTFIPNTDSKLQVNHKDGNKLNNRCSNLEWVTPAENVQHAYANGLVSPKSAEGIKHIQDAARKTVKLYSSIPIVCTTTGQVFESFHAAAVFYHVDDTTIQNMVRGITRKSRMLSGLDFEFLDPSVTQRSPHQKCK